MEAPCSRFTPAEGGARLAATACSKNTLAVEYASFISTRMIYEDAYKIRGSLFDGKQRSVYVTRASRVDVVAYELNILTDLKVVKAMKHDDVYDWFAELDKNEVLVCTSPVMQQILEEEVLTMANINVLVMDSSHLICRDDSLKYIMKLYKQCEEENRPRILALTYPLFSYPKRESTNNDKKEENVPVVDEKGDSDLPNTEISENSEIETTITTEETTITTEETTITTEENIPKTDEIVAIDPTSTLENKIVMETKIDPESESIGLYENLDDFEMYEKLEWKIEQLEKELCCQMDLAEDIDGGKRLSGSITKPKELIIEHAGMPHPSTLSEEYRNLDSYMRESVAEAMAFLDEHRYDPTEIYGEDMYEEFKNIPNPTIEPKQIFSQFLYVLDQLGPYAADKAAFSLLTKLEKLKIKVPYERHFLLLCLCTSVFVKMRCYADLMFSKYENSWEKIKTFCTPKILRLAEILEKFCPPDMKENLKSPEHFFDNKKMENRSNSNKTNELLETIEKCDFLSLSNKIEDKVNTIEANLKELDNVEIDDNSLSNKLIEKKSETKNNQEIKDSSINVENEVNNTKNEDDDAGNKHNNMENERNNIKSAPQSPQKGHVDQRGGLFPKRQGHRARGRGRSQRSNQARTQQVQLNPDALCGIVFMKEPLMAKIMFMMIADMSQSNPKLSYICAQYCAVEQPADPGTEPKECQRQGKKQEEVLKKFRMHECNLLLATSTLEEGIDLPRCNLVLRWDVPASYRSYGLCRSRARAPRATCALMSCGQADTHTLLHNVAVYTELDQIISRKCGCGVQNEPPQSEEDLADTFTHIVKPYTPHETETTTTTKTPRNKNNNAQNESGVTTENSDNSNKVNNKIETENDSELKNCDKDNNLICNKCNNKRSNVDYVCSCVLIDINSVEARDNRKGDKKSDDSIASVDLSTAIALINRYCGKLPSDTFTRLAPQWWMEEVCLPAKDGGTTTAYICTLRLPLNCPVKYNIVGHPMPTRALARRMVALQACRILHKSGELDSQLMPIGKENFKAAELDNTGNFDLNDPSDNARPGTTKRRQYYYKRTAWAFTDCQPVVDTSDTEIEQNREEEEQKKSPIEVIKTPGKKRNMLYAIVSSLWCALPERYNTRGRRLHAPQSATQAIGILMARHEPDNLQIPAFPVYTRSGEVRVSVEYVPDADVRMSPRRGRLVRRFMRFVFAEVLRVRRRGMKLQSEGSTHNNYYIVPTVKTTREDGSTKIDIDWAFLELIYQHTEDKKSSEIERPNLWQNDGEETQNQPQVKEKKKSGEVKKMANPLLNEGETFVFDAEKYREAVVTPWYRNQDQPQFFLVAEICWKLSPDSAFPSALHTTFRQYYLVKYGVTLTQTDQPLLDVDHTSNRLNLLTPRYVNRKGVALPVSSERTRRAKRDRLDQKQILVPELCRVHPFAAPLWFATVALPCVLYRINALLIADEIRRAVAIDVGLGIPKIDEKTCPGFQWPALDFGWSLAEVLSADSDKNEKRKEDDDSTKKDERVTETDDLTGERDEEISAGDIKEKTINDILQEKECTENAFEIGTWSNDMASSIPADEEYDEMMEPLPPNLTFCTSASGGTNWCDPVEKPRSQFQPSHKYNMADSDCSYMSSDFDTDDSDLNSDVSDEDDTSGFCSSRNSNAAMGVRIEYKTAHEAEAVDLERKKVNPAPLPDEEDDARDRRLHEEFIRAGDAPKQYIDKFRRSVAEHETQILQNGSLIKQDEPIVEILPEPTKESHAKLARKDLDNAKIEAADNQEKVINCKEVINSNTVMNNQGDTFIKTEIDEVDSRTKQINCKDIKHDFKIDNERNLVNIDTKNTNIDELANDLSKIHIEIKSSKDAVKQLFPYNTDLKLTNENGQISLENIEKNKRLLLAELKKNLSEEEIKKLHCFSMKDVDIDSPDYVNEKIVNVGFDHKENYKEKVEQWRNPHDYQPYFMESKSHGKEFDFDYQPNLEGHPGPSPSVILQALTMSNANDGINLERLETIGDSFLKFAITAYLYCAHPTVHEGKLSHMRSKQVSNLNLYRLGRNKRLGARMIASKFEPHDNWLPPCHKPPTTLQPKMTEKDDRSPTNPEAPSDNTGCFIPYNLITQHSIPDKSIADCVEALIGAYLLECGPRGALLFMSWLGIRVLPRHEVPLSDDHPYVTAHRHNHNTEKQTPSPLAAPLGRCDSSDTDTACSEGEGEEESYPPRAPPPALDWGWGGRALGSLKPQLTRGRWTQTIFGELRAPPSPLLRYIEDPEGELERMLSGYDALERTLQYRFKDRSLLLQALTHASHQQNRLTDCYQRLEFLGDAILDYLITRHLYEDPRRHSPGALTDLRSALVNNTIFATLAARHGLHKYFRHTSPALNEVLSKYVSIQQENGHSISEEHYLIQEDEMEQAEDVEVPKALGDLFESVAGAIFLDSGMSLGAVWKSYVNLMGAELEAFSAAAPKSPVRELLEAEPDTAKFGKPERLADGRRVRVCVEVFGRGAFKGVGRNYRIAKGTAARCALRHLKIHRQR